MDEEGTSTNFSSDYYDNDAYSFYHRCGLAEIPFHPEFRAAQVVVRWLYPLLLVVGTLGNGISIVILGRLSVTAWSSSLYLAMLALVEMLVLPIRCGGTWFEKVTGVNPSMRVMRLSDAMCKCYLFVLNVLLQLWPWLMVAVSVDLTIATTRPLNTYTSCTRERARITILLITILLICLNLNFFWTWGLLGGLCIYIEEFSLQFMNVIWPSIEMTVKHILPLVVVATVFIVIVVNLLRSGSIRVSSYEPILRRYFLDLQALQQLKQACLVLVVLFVVIKTFTFSVELVNALVLRGVIVVPCERYARFKSYFTFVQTVRDTCVYSFHSLKFFVYFIFCASFRRHFADFVRKLAFCRKTQTHTETVPNGVVKNGSPKRSDRK